MNSPPESARARRHAGRCNARATSATIPLAMRYALAHPGGKSVSICNTLHTLRTFRYQLDSSHPSIAGVALAQCSVSRCRSLVDRNAKLTLTAMGCPRSGGIAGWHTSSTRHAWRSYVRAAITAVTRIARRHWHLSCRFACDGDRNLMGPQPPCRPAHARVAGFPRARHH